MTATNEAATTENPAVVTFDTLAAAQELTAAGLDDRQAEAIVTTVSKAMSETVATKADLELQGTATRADMESQSAALRADMESQGAALRADIDLLRADMNTLRAEVKGDIKALRAEMKGDMKHLEQTMATLQDKIVLKLGALMVTMAFLLLALGPFYFRWVMSLAAS